MIAELAWPLAVVAVAIVFFLIFRKPIGRLIDRTRHVSRDGIQADPSEQEARVTEPGTPADKLLRELDNTLVVRAENKIREELKERQVVDAGEKERVLTRYLAGVTLAYVFLYLYEHVYGSQITALRLLAAHGPEGTQPDALRVFYEQGKSNNPSLYANYNFEDWIGWLESNSLVVRDDGEVSISLEGREFLKFLLDQGLSPYKRG